MTRLRCLSWFIFFFVVSAMVANSNPEVIEIGPHNKDLLPGGKEADGIIGDFLMRNDLIEAIISCNAPLRKANMGTNWGDITPGCLYDLTLQGQNNDQLTIFAPGNQQGPVSYVRIVEDGSNWLASVETVISAAMNGGLYKRHEYQLRDGWQGLWIITTVRNESQETKKFSPNDRITNLSEVKTVNSITVGNAIYPIDKAGYAFGWIEDENRPIPPNSIELKPGEEISYSRFIAVGLSPAEAYGIVYSIQEQTSQFQTVIRDQNNQPIPSARIDIPIGDQMLPAYPDEDGLVKLPLPAGQYKIEITDRGRPAVSADVRVGGRRSSQQEFVMKPASKVIFDIQTENGQDSPCKVQFIGINGTETPNLGPANQAKGCLEQYHSETGKFEVALPPGNYTIIVTRGIEFNHLQQDIELSEGETETVKGALRRIVDTTGWVSSDFHNHSTPSGDNTCGTYDRIINLAAEHIEFAPTTEHNRLYDWQPYIDRLGLQDEICTIPGIELTGSGAHFNAFPFTPVPKTQDGGAPQWQVDPRLNAIVLRDFQGFMPERWVQINHPDMVADFIDRDGDGNSDGGYLGLEDLIDAAETWGPRTTDGNILTRAPFHIEHVSDEKEEVRYHRQFIWLQMLNMGHRYWCVAVSDAHSVHGNGVGGWRTYIPSSVDIPSEFDWKELIRNAKAGQMVISNGPFLEVSTADGTIAGGLTRALGSIDLHIRVQCTDWIDIDRIQIMVNGRQRSDLNFTRKSHPDWFQNDVVKFDHTINVSLSEDSHIIVAAYGDSFNLKTGYGASWQSDMNPCAYNNPIFVDVDGGGFTPNGDTLEFPLPTKRIPVEEAKRMLKRLQ